MRHRFALAACLVFSGLAALVYQILWTRLLGFAFGTTTEVVATVLGVFFGGMAIGNLLAARHLAKVERPLRVYAWIELAIGLFALATLPVLRELEAFYASLVAGQGTFVTSAIRLAIASLVLLPPTIGMGATLPFVARGLVADDASIGRWSGTLYAANTLGAVAGAYLTGFWLLPGLGLTRTIFIAVALNVAVALFVLAVAGKLRVNRTAVGGSVSVPEGVQPAAAVARGPFLVFFAISGFVAIGYEIVWSRVFGIVMEGTIYGFSAVLSAYLLGIALGSLAIAFSVDRIRNLTRAFGLLHLAIAVSVALGMAAVPYLPLALARLAGWSGGGDAVHLLFVLVAPIVLLPTALFGAAFPILIRIYTSTADRVGEGMGIATAANTAGSILASLVVGLWLIPAAGIDASLYLVLICQLGVAVVILTKYQPGALRTRLGPAALAAVGAIGVALLFSGVHADRAITGRTLEVEGLGAYAGALAARDETRVFLSEGKTSIVTVYDAPGARTLQTNGMPEAGLRLGLRIWRVRPYCSRSCLTCWRKIRARRW